MGSAVFGIVGAVIGAGFASGREIMSFFSRYGLWSWPLILWSVAWEMGTALFLMNRGAGESLPRGRFCRLWMLVLLGFAAGGMTAAGGDLAALTVPVRGIRVWGSACTLLLCLLLSCRALQAAALLARLLIPGLILALWACLRMQGMNGTAETADPSALPGALLRAAGYAGVNGTLALGVISDAGKGKTAKQRLWIVGLSGLTLLFMTALFNAALLPHIPQMRGAALPTVLLLRSFGKTGYYVSAVLLYLAIASTLIAALRGMRALMPGKHGAALSGLMAFAASLIGFRDIVDAAYPALGLISLIIFFTGSYRTNLHRKSL